ncbi:hypothetical protein JX266_001319 [Neoarthrinium moseri]|nr:hypothetical protein JX266_001319 [Neoarthrinium moseri]
MPVDGTGQAQRAGMVSDGLSQEPHDLPASLFRLSSLRARPRWAAPRRMIALIATMNGGAIPHCLEKSRSRGKGTAYSSASPTDRTFGARVYCAARDRLELRAGTRLASSYGGHSPGAPSRWRNLNQASWIP